MKTLAIVILGLLPLGLLYFWKPIQFAQVFLAPVELHGKIVDQYGAPIPSAKIKYSVLGFASKPKGTLESRLDGTFEITRQRGASLFVAVSKTGYRTWRATEREVGSEQRFDFANEPRPTSSAASPIVFKLQRPGVIEPLVHAKERSYRLLRNGNPKEIELNPGGSPHKLVLRCWNKELEPRPPKEMRYDWRLEIEVIDGGLVERTDAMNFVAPNEGYLAKDIIDMPVNAKIRWSSNENRDYYIRFNDGVFARISLQMFAGGDHFVVCESFLNPKPGSRYLETDPPKP